MHYIFESIIVGIYSIIIYLILNNFIKNIYLLFFLIGFVKHLFGYLLNIHNIYCNYGYMCEKNIHKYAIYSNQIWIESILEGILYLFFGILLTKIIKNKIIVFFIIGVLLHITFEKIGVHNSFCKNRCKNI